MKHHLDCVDRSDRPLYSATSRARQQGYLVSSLSYAILCNPTRSVSLFSVRVPALDEPYLGPYRTPRHTLAGFRHRPAFSFRAPCRRPRTQSVSCPLSAGRRRRPAAPFLLCRHARARAKFGACTGSSESIRILGLQRRYPSRSCSLCLSPDPAFRSLRRVAASRPRLALASKRQAW